MPQHTRGFTILELVIVIGIIGVLFFVAIINTPQQTGPSGNVQRRADVNGLLVAIGKYRDANQGKLPEGITTTPKKITSTQNEDAVNLCAALVPNYVTTLPLDPAVGSISPAKAKCTDNNARYNTGYTIQTTSENKVKVAAPDAVGGEVIFAAD